MYAAFKGSQEPRPVLCEGSWTHITASSPSLTWRLHWGTPSILSSTAAAVLLENHKNRRNASETPLTTAALVTSTDHKALRAQQRLTPRHCRGNSCVLGGCTEFSINSNSSFCIRYVYIVSQVRVRTWSRCSVKHTVATVIVHPPQVIAVIVHALGGAYVTGTFRGTPPSVQQQL